MELEPMRNCDSLLSVIIPVYNVEEYISECLLSVVRQDYANMEIIVINDGSTDHSLKVVENIALRYTNIQIYTKQNGGLSDARNFGLKKAKGDFITFIDSDDILLGTDIYSRIMQCFIVDDRIDVIQYDVIHKWNSQEEHKRNYPFRIYSTHEEIANGYLKEHIHVSCCDKVFKKKVFEGVKFPLRQQCEDIAIIPQLIENIDKLQTTEIGYYGYRFREGSISTSSLNTAKLLGILTSYYSYLSYTYHFKNLKALTLDKYTSFIWSYCSAIRKSNPDSISIFLNSPIFIRISILEWIVLVKQIKRETLFKSFVSCVLGPKFIVKLQKILTR